MKYAVCLCSSMLLLFTSCYHLPELERTVIVTGYDFTTFTEKGFMFTPEQYLEPYDAMGVVEITIIPETKKWEPAASEGSKFKEVVLTGQDRWWVENISPQFILNEAYKKAKELGADALVRFTIEKEQVQHGNFSIPVHHVNGLAIRRKKN